MAIAYTLRMANRVGWWKLWTAMRPKLRLMSKQDITRLELKVDQLVSFKSRTIEMRHQRVLEFDIRPGNAMMYCPECNVLFCRAVDPRSKTPAFKNELVTVTAEG
jgi:hypothetical protein